MGMMLVAHEHGLGSGWVGAFREDEVSRILKYRTICGNSNSSCWLSVKGSISSPRVSKKEAVE